MFLEESFECLLSNTVSLDETRRKRAIRAQNALRDRLKAVDEVKERLTGMYLQGSYALHTTVRPCDDDIEYDVDIILAADFQDHRDSWLQTGGYTLQWLQDQIESISLYKNKTRLLQHCVRVQYESDQQRFHLDVVPAHRPDTTGGEILICPDWAASNPKGFIDWFNAQKHRCGRLRHITRLLKYWRNLHGDEPNSMILTTLVGHHAPDEGAYRTLDHALVQTMTGISKWLNENASLLFGVDVPNPSLESENLARGWNGALSFVSLLDSATKLAQEAICCSDEEETIELWNAPELFDGCFPQTVRGLGQAERKVRNGIQSKSAFTGAAGAISVSRQKGHQCVPDNGGFYGTK